MCIEKQIRKNWEIIGNIHLYKNRYSKNNNMEWPPIMRNYFQQYTNTDST